MIWSNSIMLFPIAQFIAAMAEVTNHYYLVRQWLFVLPDLFERSPFDNLIGTLKKSLWQHHISSPTYRLRSTGEWSCETARTWWYLKWLLRRITYQRHFHHFLLQILEFFDLLLMISNYTVPVTIYFSQFKCSGIATNAARHHTSKTLYLRNCVQHFSSFRCRT